MVDKAHPFDKWRGQWELARRRAAAGDRGSAVLTLCMVSAMLDVANQAAADAPYPPLPDWLVRELGEILSAAIKAGGGLDKAFFLDQKRGRNLMRNATRDMEIHTYISMELFPTLEELADAAEKLGLPPPARDGVWTAASLAKAAKAHERRIKSGLLFTGEK